MDEMKISVVIPVRNGERTIGRCLEGISSQTCSPYEVIVVDGHSKDRTVNVASKFPVKIIDETYGTVGGGRQVGLEHANGEYIAFTDADCVPERNWLGNLIRAFDKGLLGVGGSTKNVGEGTWGRAIALTTNTFLGSANSVQGRLFKEKRIVKSISGCNSIYRKQTLVEIGGFDVRLSINEDTELNQRLSKLGRLLYTPDAIVLHNQRRGLKEFAKRMVQFGYWRGRLRLWGLQCLPPIAALLFLFSLIFTHWFFLGGIVLYAVLLISTGLKFAVNEKKIEFAISMPITYFVQHCSYIAGFWMGFFNFQRRDQVSNEVS